MTERAPVGIARVGRRLYLVDGDGVLLDDYGPRFSALGLPIIDGLAGRAGAAPEVDRRRAALASRLIGQVSRHEELAGAFRRSTCGTRRTPSFSLAGPGAHPLGAERFVERLSTYLDVAPTLGHRCRTSMPDLRFAGASTCVRPERTGAAGGLAREAADGRRAARAAQRRDVWRAVSVTWLGST